jgi:predicted CoA-substrate-specific enzyme activase
LDNQSSSEFKDEPVMITAGLDIGHQSVKGIILADRQIIRHITLKLSGEVDASAKMAFERLLTEARLQPSQVGRVFATGIEREKVSIADGHRTEMLCHLKGAHWLFPGARTVIDLGAEGIRVLRGDAEGNLRDFMMNDKCAAGTGIFLETVAMMLRIPLAEMGSLSRRGSGKLVLTSTCAVFAESEIVGEIHRGTPMEDILQAVHESVATKIAQLSRRIGLEPQLILTGGVARNSGIIEALEKNLELAIRTPENPEIVGALGAAILARNSPGEKR